MGRITLIRRWFKIVTGQNRVAVKQDKGKYYSKNEIKGYYNNLTGKVNKDTILDENGIPMNLIANNKFVYFPISIFQYALGIWDLYLETSKDEYRNIFLKICDWIVENQEEDGSWNCFSPIGYKNFTVSSMGQGEAISVLVRAYRLNKKQKWYVSIKNAVTFMLKDVQQGGTLLVENENFIFEEYASITGEKRSVLNGWIFSLFGLYDYLLLEKDDKAKIVFIKSLETLKRMIKKYDTGYWSLYDLTGRIASPAYHDLHISLLQTLADLTEERIFSDTAFRWGEYQTNTFFKTKAILKKVFQKFRESPEGIIIK